MRNTKRKAILSFIILFGLAIIVAVPLTIYLINVQDTSELVGRVLNVRSTQVVDDSYSTFIDFETKDTAKFSSDIGKEVKYKKFGDEITFFNVRFQGQEYSELKAQINRHSYNYVDNDERQYFFIDVYGGNDRAIATTYPDDTVFEKYDIVDSFSVKYFEEVEEEKPNFMPDIHETPANLSQIDELSINFFNQVKMFVFQDNDKVVVLMNDDTIIEGTYHQFAFGEIYLNLGEKYRTKKDYVKMKITSGYPDVMGGYYDGSDPCVYDSKYSNLTPPPYFEGTNLFIYWSSENSVYIIR